MDLDPSQPFRFRCNIPLENLQHIMSVVPVALALMLKDDEVVSPSLCFVAGGCNFYITIEKGENGCFEVILEDISDVDSAPEGSRLIDSKTLDEMRKYFESQQDWENN